jgi:hypothetical protein
MVRRAPAVARVGPHRCSPVRTESPLRENLRFITDRALLASLHRRRLCARKGGTDNCAVRVAGHPSSAGHRGVVACRLLCGETLALGARARARCVVGYLRFRRNSSYSRDGGTTDEQAGSSVEAAAGELRPSDAGHRRGRVPPYLRDHWCRSCPLSCPGSRPRPRSRRGGAGR